MPSCPGPKALDRRRPKKLGSGASRPQRVGGARPGRSPGLDLLKAEKLNIENQRRARWDKAAGAALAVAVLGG